MSIIDGITKLFSSGAEKIIDSVGEAIDKNVTNDEERLQKRNELEQLKADLKLKADKMAVDLEKEFTKRQELDMQSDSRLSKNIRPLTLIFLLAVITVLAFADGNVTIGGNTFTVNAAYVELYQTLLLAAFTFYFGSRGAEKLMKIWKGK